jgi:hypothetical protein
LTAVMDHTCRARFSIHLATLPFAVAMPVGVQTASSTASTQRPTAGITSGTLKDAAGDSFQKGPIAALQQDSKLAIRYFLGAQKPLVPREAIGGNP